TAPSRAFSSAPRTPSSSRPLRAHRADNGFPMVNEAFALVLHSHLPYARGAGRWPHGEEWVHEAILGTYLPILGLLHDMRAEGVAYRMTIGLTPTLLEQLADADIDKRFIEYVDDQIKRADQDVK